MKDFIDLRSDTVTKPSAKMREAMAMAEVGDDVFGEDPSVNLLQEKAAALFDKDAAIFTCSGTMANQLAIKAQTQPGDEIIADLNSHTFNAEAAAPAALSGVQVFPIEGNRGILDASIIGNAIRPVGDPHYAITRLICLENTHNRGGGSVYPLETIKEIYQLAKKHGLLVHLDGARIFNASVSSGIDVSEYARYFDSVSFCLSKGLGCPVGSLVVGSKELIDSVMRFRKMFGGGMRQIGILAAAGIYALDNNIKRLEQDHQNAKKLAFAISELPGVRIDPQEVETNLVFCDIAETGKTQQEIIACLKKEGVLVGPNQRTRLRLVTHMDVNGDDIDKAIVCLRNVLC
jgi:threonine aldolase